MYIVYISVNITADQSLSPVSPIESPLTNPDNPLDTSHVSSTYQNRKSRGLPHIAKNEEIVIFMHIILFSNLVITFICNIKCPLFH